MRNGKIRSILAALFMALVAVSMLTSCNPETSKISNIRFGAFLENSRSVSVIGSETHYLFQYKATPLWPHTAGTVVGETLDWTNFNQYLTDESIKPELCTDFMDSVEHGKWKFEVRAVKAAWSGSQWTDVKDASGKDFIIFVTNDVELYVDSTTTVICFDMEYAPYNSDVVLQYGYLNVDIKAKYDHDRNASSEYQNAKVVISLLDGDTFLAADGTPSTDTLEVAAESTMVSGDPYDDIAFKYVGSDYRLPEGIHSAILAYYGYENGASTLWGTQELTFEILAGQTVTIGKGTNDILYPGRSDIKFDMVSTGIYGLITEADLALEQNGTTITATYITSPDLSGVPSGYSLDVRFYVDGVEVQNGSGNGTVTDNVYTFGMGTGVFTEYGTKYIITGVSKLTRLSDGKVLGVGYSSKSYFQYRITFNANGGSGTCPSTMYVSNLITDLVLPSGSLTKSGYTFVGWNTTADGSGTSYIDGKLFIPKQNYDFYANWIDLNNWQVGGTIYYVGRNNTADYLFFNSSKQRMSVPANPTVDELADAVYYFRTTDPNAGVDLSAEQSRDRFYVIYTYDAIASKATVKDTDFNNLKVNKKWSGDRNSPVPTSSAFGRGEYNTQLCITTISAIRNYDTTIWYLLSQFNAGSSTFNNRNQSDWYIGASRDYAKAALYAKDHPTSYVRKLFYTQGVKIWTSSQSKKDRAYYYLLDAKKGPIAKNEQKDKTLHMVPVRSF